MNDERTDQYEDHCSNGNWLISPVNIYAIRWRIGEKLKCSVVKICGFEDLIIWRKWWNTHFDFETLTKCYITLLEIIINTYYCNYFNDWKIGSDWKREKQGWQHPNLKTEIQKTNNNKVFRIISYKNSSTSHKMPIMDILTWL